MGNSQMFLELVQKRIAEMQRHKGVKGELFKCIAFFRNFEADSVVYSYKFCFPDDPILKTDLNSIIGNTAIDSGFAATTHHYDPREYEF